MGDLIGHLRLLPATQGEIYKVEVYIRNAGNTRRRVTPSFGGGGRWKVFLEGCHLH